MNALEVSIIFGTYNRLECLKNAVASIRTSIGPHSYEIVITDGGSTDGSLEWLESQPDIVIAGRNNLRGAVSAFNAAWVASKGELIANFNDDALYLDDALAKGIDLLRSDPKIGQVSLLSNDCAPGGLAYSNFGISPRSVVEKVCAKQGGPKHYWNPIYYTYAGDYEYSAWIWNLGYEVSVMPGKWVKDLADTRDFLHRRNLTITFARLEGQLLLSRCSSKEKILTTGPG